MDIFVSKFKELALAAEKDADLTAELHKLCEAELPANATPSQLSIIAKHCARNGLANPAGLLLCYTAGRPRDVFEEIVRTLVSGPAALLERLAVERYRLSPQQTVFMLSTVLWQARDRIRTVDDDAWINPITQLADRLDVAIAEHDNDNDNDNDNDDEHDREDPFVVDDDTRASIVTSLATIRSAPDKDARHSEWLVLVRRLVEMLVLRKKKGPVDYYPGSSGRIADGIGRLIFVYGNYELADLLYGGEGPMSSAGEPTDALAKIITRYRPQRADDSSTISAFAICMWAPRSPEAMQLLVNALADAGPRALPAVVATKDVIVALTAVLRTLPSLQARVCGLILAGVVASDHLPLSETTLIAVRIAAKFVPYTESLVRMLRGVCNDYRRSARYVALRAAIDPVPNITEHM